jgi:cyclophilin family peptidyl-prolyl cis-trans isomerase
MTFATRDGKIGKVVIELFNDVVPRTVENFLGLCKKKRGEGYLGCSVHRIIPGFMLQTGDYERGDGSGGSSIYGRYFEDENFQLKHDRPGLLSMANSGDNTNGSQFFITFDPQPHLDGKHVVFGEVIEGLEILREIEEQGSEQGIPKEQIRIVECGVHKN